MMMELITFTIKFACMVILTFQSSIRFEKSDISEKKREAYFFSLDKETAKRADGMFNIFFYVFPEDIKGKPSAEDISRMNQYAKSEYMKITEYSENTTHRMIGGQRVYGEIQSVKKLGNSIVETYVVQLTKSKKYLFIGFQYGERIDRVSVDEVIGQILGSIKEK